MEVKTVLHTHGVSPISSEFCEKNAQKYKCSSTTCCVVDAESVLLIAAVTKGLMEYLSTVKHIKVKDSWTQNTALAVCVFRYCML